MYSYKKLEQLLSKKEMNKSELVNHGFSSKTIAKLKKGEKLSNTSLNKLASFLNCDTNDLYEVISSNPLLQKLREEKEYKIHGGLYHELQIRMTYNSNHIEGSKLDEDQTRYIFETKTILSNEGLPVNDVIETVNHFKAIDYCLEIAEEPLSEDIIKHLHYLLKQGTYDSVLSWFKVGDYKVKPNAVGGISTARPIDVPIKIKELLDNYNKKENVTFEDIVEFHVNFERIHPFQDGNGRVGRLIAFKECLKNNLIPFYIDDAKKAFYYRGLKNWDQDKAWLIDTCYDSQDTFQKLIDLFK